MHRGPQSRPHHLFTLRAESAVQGVVRSHIPTAAPVALALSPCCSTAAVKMARVSCCVGCSMQLRQALELGLRLRISWAWRAVSIRCRDSSCDGPRYDTGCARKAFPLKRELSTVQKTKTEPGKTEPGFWFSLSGILFCGFCHSGKKFLPTIPLCYVMCHMLQIGCSAALCTKGSSSNCV